MSGQWLHDSDSHVGLKSDFLSAGRGKLSWRLWSRLLGLEKPGDINKAMMHWAGMRDFFISAPVGRTRQEEREDNTEVLNVLEEQGLQGWRVLKPQGTGGSEREVGEGGRDAAGCKRWAGSGWMALEEHEWSSLWGDKHLWECVCACDSGKDKVRR